MTLGRAEGGKSGSQGLEATISGDGVCMGDTFSAFFCVVV